MRWQATPAEQLLWAVYEDDLVLFHRPSGQTHFVNAVTELLLTEVLREPRSLRETVVALLDAQQAPANPEYEPQVFGLLLRLEELGLVRRADA